MLVPRLAQQQVVRTLGERLRASGVVRIAPAFPEAVAVGLMRALIGSEHAAVQAVDAERGLQLWRFGWEPGVGCDHPLCELGRWLRGDGVAWASALSGLPLRAPASAILTSERACKAAFADAYDAAWSDEAAIGVRVHLTTAPWPEVWGGHLEVLDADDALVGRCGPAWNAIDVIDLERARRYQLPLIDRHVDGYAIAAGFELAMSD